MHRTRVIRPEYPDEDISREGLRSFEIFKDRSIFDYKSSKSVFIFVNFT